MAGVGPAPKDPATRRRRNKPAVPIATVTPDRALRGPDLPDLPALPDHGEESWHPQTLAWYQTWRASAQAQTFTDTDWDFLIDTALMHHTMWSKGSRDLASEVRLRGAKLGATKDDRKRLGIDVTDPTRKPPRKAPRRGGKVTDISTRRRLLDEG